MGLKSFRYLEHSYEKRLLFWLSELDRFCESKEIPYALFGGAAVGAYAGHLPRKLHDLDVISDREGSRMIEVFLVEHQFKKQETVKARVADYTKFMLRNHVYDMIISIFPSTFTLINIDDEQFPVLDVYDFSPALSHRRRLSIRSLGCDESTSVSVVPLEDLLVSKLWPTFEPNTVHDLLLLLASKYGSALDGKYLSQRIEANPILRPLVLESFVRFERIYPETSWFRLAHIGMQGPLQLLKKIVVPSTAESSKNAVSL
jgi:hypothetical protein